MGRRPAPRRTRRTPSREARRSAPSRPQEMRSRSIDEPVPPRPWSRNCAATPAPRRRMTRRHRRLRRFVGQAQGLNERTGLPPELHPPPRRAAWDRLPSPCTRPPPSPCHPEARRGPCPTRCFERPEPAPPTCGSRSMTPPHRPASPPPRPPTAPRAPPAATSTDAAAARWPRRSTRRRSSLRRTPGWEARCRDRGRREASYGRPPATGRTRPPETGHARLVADHEARHLVRSAAGAARSAPAGSRSAARCAPPPTSRQSHPSSPTTRLRPAIRLDSLSSAMNAPTSLGVLFDVHTVCRPASCRAS